MRVGEGDSGERLDKFVSSKLPEISRALAQHLIEEGKVRASGLVRKSNYRIKPGDEILVSIPPPRETSARPEQIPLDIIFEDADLIVVAKPAGMVVHPAAGHTSGTLVNAVLGHSPRLVVGNAERPGLVHRLDRDTSGLIVIAKQDAALRSLQRQFASRAVYKAYLALVHGRVETAQGKIEASIGRDPRDRKRFAILASTHARQATTVFRVEERVEGYTLLKVEPKTGRTHQIRVHLAFIKHPVVGDRVYGRKNGDELGLTRQFLHAWRLSFLHPTSGSSMEFTAPLPFDLAEALRRAGGEPAPWI